MIYADNAATTQMSEAAISAILNCMEETWGNPSSLYGLGQRAKEILEDARERIAACIGASPKEITFTSGGSEADNQAIRSAALLGARKGKRHIISTTFEHHAVLHTLKKLEREGFEVELLPVGELGTVTAQQVADAIREDTALVTIMYANNEIGSILPIPEIGAVCRERGKRAGTENVPAIVGMAAALEDACSHLSENAAKVSALRDLLIGGLSQVPHSALNGDPVNRLPGNVNFCFEGIEGESLLLPLDDRGICASPGSACTSGSLDPSHVLLAIGRPHEVAHGSLRLSLCKENTEADVDTILEAAPEIVSYLRNMSPLWKDKFGGKKEFVL